MLAERLGKELLELDSLIEQKAGKNIPKIFQQDGEVHFRELEIAVTKQVSGKKSAIIACGGGIVLNKINIDRLREECIIIYLTASPSVILKRTAGDENERPLLEANGKVGHIRELLKFRKTFYERAADIKINTSKLNVESVVDQIIERLKENES